MSDQDKTQNVTGKGAYVDPDICIGCMLCSQICPKVFEILPDGKSEAVDPHGDTEANIEDAIQQCPVDAISEKDDIYVIDQDECTECGSCVEICPTEAIIEE